MVNFLEMNFVRKRGFLKWNTAFSPISAFLVSREARFAPSLRLELEEKRHPLKRNLPNGLH